MATPRCVVYHCYSHQASPDGDDRGGKSSVVQYPLGFRSKQALPGANEKSSWPPCIITIQSRKAAKAAVTLRML